MSGPKCTSYEIARRRRMEELARRRREAKAREERRVALAGRAEALSAAVDDVGRQWLETSREHDAFPPWLRGPTLRDRIEAATGQRDNDAVEASLNDIAEDVAQARRDYAQQIVFLRMRTSLQAAAAAAVATGSTAADRAREAAEREERELRRHAEKIAQLLDTLATGVSTEDRTAIERRAEESLAAKRGRRNALLLQIHLDVQRANEAAEARQRVERQVEKWREDIYGLQGSDVEQLDLMLRQVATGEAILPLDMEQRVEQVVARATAKWEQDYALGVVAEELQNLGYVVEAGFETASAQAPEMLLRKPDMEDAYHVSLRAEPGAPRFYTEVVREADGAESNAPRSVSRERIDHAVESAWCGDFAAALAAAQDKGVRARLVSRNRPGEIPVGTIAPLASTTKRKRRRRRRRTDQPLSRMER